MWNPLEYRLLVSVEKMAAFLKCKKKYSGGEDIGFVGDITEVNPKILYDLLEKDFLPIVFPIGFDDNYDSL